MSEVGRIARAIQQYAHENNGTVDIPYAEIPRVAWSIEALSRTRGVLVLADHNTFSTLDPVPIGFYSVGGVVIAGFSDGTARYHRFTDRPPWVGLREGPTFWERMMIASPLLNIVLLVMLLDRRHVNRENSSRSNYKRGTQPVAEWISCAAAGLLTFLLSWIVLELLRFLFLPFSFARGLDLIILLTAFLIGYTVYRRRLSSKPVLKPKT